VISLVVSQWVPPAEPSAAEDAAAVPAAAS
jgi:hypothetical protein